MTHASTTATSDRRRWGDALDGAPTLDLPTDRPRGGVRARNRTALVQASARDRPALLAGRLGVTVQDLMLAVWVAVLARDADATDLVVGCWSVPGAPEGSLIVHRQEVDLHASFGQHVRTTAAGLRSSVAAGPATVDELCSVLGVEPGSARHPFFQVGIAPGGLPRPLPGLSSLTVPLDLLLVVTEGPATVELRLEYAEQLFDEVRARRLLSRVLLLLEEGAARADEAVGDLRVLSEEESALLARWNGTAAPHDPDQRLYDLVAAQVDRTPDAVAVEDGAVRLTYRELDDRACALAGRLRDLGVGPDVRVAVSMERSAELVVAVLAVVVAGGAYVPVDPTYPRARREHMVEASGARVLLRRDWAGEPLGRAAGVDVVVVDVPAPGSHVPPASRPPQEATGAHLGYVVFTSGSTGRPKGVALPQRALTNLVHWQLGRDGFRAGARTVQYSSLSFDVSFQELFTTWASGGTLVLVSEPVRRDSRGLLDHLVAHRVERIFLPFVALRGLAEAAVASGTYPHTLREVYTAGEQLRVDDTLRRLFRSLPDCLLENQYGPSESHVVSAHRLSGPPEDWPALPPIGGPVANTTLHVLDAAGHRRPIGVPGELYIEGVCLAREYLGRPDLTRERFVEVVTGGTTRRAYRTGDLVRWNEAGVLEFLGRADDQVKFRGFRIEPGEVAAVLSDYSGVGNAAVAVADVEGVGSRLAAWVVPSDGAAVDLAGLHRHAQDRLPDYMVPSRVRVVDALPLTSSGKVDIRALPAPTFDRRVLSVAYRGPRTAQETSMVQLWEHLLGVERIGLDDDFFELGGDSLLAVALFEEVGQRFGRELPLGALAESPTVAGLVAHLGDEAAEESWDALVPLRREGSRRPLFCIHGGFGNVASFPLLARALPTEQPVYALQWDGLSGSGGARSIEEMASRYLAAVREVQPEGPYRFAGQCIGGLVGREMTRQLQAEGEDVDLLVMYDSPNLYSSHYRLHPRLPAVPRGFRRQVMTVFGAVQGVQRLVAGVRPRRRLLRVAARSRLRRPIAAGKDREIFGEQVMLRAAWRYRVRFTHHVRTLYLHSGIRRGGRIALLGVWTDGLMGWSEHVGPHFEAVEVSSEHNAVPYDPESVKRLAAALDELG